MGNYLPEPIRDKVINDVSNKFISAGDASMQGWRLSQEDAHNVILDYDEDLKTMYFAVYDGHGGAEVAQYASQKLPEMLQAMETYKTDLVNALIEVFLKFDAHTIEAETIAKLVDMAQLGEDNGDEDEDNEDESNEVSLLSKDASIPLAVLLESYKELKKGNMESPDLKAMLKKAKEFENEKNKKIAENKDKSPSSDTNNEKNGEAENISEDDTKEENSDVEDSKPEDLSKSNEVGGSSSMGSSGSSDYTGGGDTVDIGKSAGGSGSKDDDDDEEDSQDDSDENSEYFDYDDSDDSDDGTDDVPPLSNFQGSGEPGYDSGCTAVVAIIRNSRLYVANAGDSRCIVSRSGVAVEMSEDHKPEDDIERTRIEKAGGVVTQDGRVNNGLNLSRALGDHAFKTNSALSSIEQMISPEPDVRILDLDERDEFMVLACDGIWNVMTNQEVVTYIKDIMISKPDTKLSDICSQLFESCIAPNTSSDCTGCDNMSCIIVDLSKLPKDKVSVEKQDKGVILAEKRSCVSDLSESDSENVAKKLKPN